MCWTSQPTVRNQLMTEIGQRMCDCFPQQWNLWDNWQRERGRNMLRSYKKFKHEFYIS